MPHPCCGCFLYLVEIIYVYTVWEKVRGKPLCDRPVRYHSSIFFPNALSPIVFAQFAAAQIKLACAKLVAVASVATTRRRKQKKIYIGEQKIRTIERDKCEESARKHKKKNREKILISAAHFQKVRSLHHPLFWKLCHRIQLISCY